MVNFIFYRERGLWLGSWAETARCPELCRVTVREEGRDTWGAWISSEVDGRKHSAGT